MGLIATYHGSADLKAAIVAQAVRHQEFDMLRRGTYGDRGGVRGFIGCSIGCMDFEMRDITEMDNPRAFIHDRVAAYHGWPAWLAHLNDSLFESSSYDHSRELHVQIRDAVPVGADVSEVRKAYVLGGLEQAGYSANVVREVEEARRVSFPSESVWRAGYGAVSSDGGGKRLLPVLAVGALHFGNEHLRSYSHLLCAVLGHNDKGTWEVAREQTQRLIRELRAAPPMRPAPPTNEEAVRGYLQRLSDSDTCSRPLRRAHASV